VAGPIRGSSMANSRPWGGGGGGVSVYSAFRGVGVGNILAVPLCWGGDREAMA